MKSKIKTFYAVQCVREAPNEPKKYIGTICGLFKDKENAEDCRDFLVKSAMPNYTYEIHVIITDLK